MNEEDRTRLEEFPPIQLDTLQTRNHPCNGLRENEQDPFQFTRG